MFYLLYLSIYLFYVVIAFVYRYYQFYCLLLWLLLLTHLFNSFRSSFSGSFICFILLSVISIFMFMLPVFISTLLFICYYHFIVTCVLIHFVKSLCFQLSYCHCYLYNSVLVLVVWMLILLFY